MEDRALRLSAALAYYAMFSLGPLLFIVIMLAGMVFGEEAVRGQVQQQLQSFVGEKSAQTIESMMAARKLGASPVTTVIAIVTLLFGASGVFGQLQDALNTIWEVRAKPGRGLAGFLRQRFLSLSMVLGLGFLLLISMVITTAVEAFAGTLGRWLPVPPFVMVAVSVAIGFCVVTLLFAMIFKFLPDVKVPWRPVWIGALGTALLFTIGKFLMGLYLGREGTASAYGAAGSVIVILLWIYYSSVILFFGAEFTQVYAKKTSARIVPSQYAVPVTEEARAQQGMPSEGRHHAAPAYARRSMEERPLAEQEFLADGAVVRHPWRYLAFAIGIGAATAW
jgi:membrane protein